MSGALIFRQRLLETTASTNEEIKRALEAGEPEGLVVCARQQTGGYGRQGRGWASPEGGLYLSLLLRPCVEASLLPTLSLAVSVALRRALVRVTNTEAIKVKWPNDLIVPAALDADGRTEDQPYTYCKLCGISLEASGAGVCVGIGVNVFKPAEGSAVGGKNIPVYLDDLGYTGSLSAVRMAVLEELRRAYCLWQEQGFASLLSEYVENMSHKGCQVSMVDQGGQAVARGTVVTVDEQGRFVLRTSDGSLVPICSGEVHVM